MGHGHHGRKFLRKLGSCGLVTLGFLAEQHSPDEVLNSRTLGTKENIIHLVARIGNVNFLKEVVRKWPELIFEKNSYGETPLHIAAGRDDDNDMCLKVLVSGVESYIEANPRSAPVVPWRENNSEGNTALHVALIYCNVLCAAYLVDKDPELAAFVNNFGETPLHLAVRYHMDDDLEAALATRLLAYVPEAPFMIRDDLTGIPTLSVKDMSLSLSIIKLLLKTNNSVAVLRDANGLTPLLRAAVLKRSCVPTIETILDYSPESANVLDGSGKTILHLLCHEPPKYEDYENLLWTYPIHTLKNRKDSQGNTPAHMAVKNRNFLLLKALIEYLTPDLTIKNKEGVSARYLIQQQIDNFQDLFTKGNVADLDFFTYVQDLKRSLPLVIKDVIGESLDPELEELVKTVASLVDVIREPECGSLLLWLEAVAKGRHQPLSRQSFVVGYPLHTMVTWIPQAVNKWVLGESKSHFDRLMSAGALFWSKGKFTSNCPPPWKLKDEDGNTPLHLALLLAAAATNDSQKSNLLECIIQFFDFDVTLCAFQNNHNDTPLHLLSQVSVAPDAVEAIRDACNKAAFPKECLQWRDKDGLTPILRAAQHNNFTMIQLFCTLDGCSSILIPREDTRTLWHLIAEKPPHELNDRNREDLDHLVDSVYGTKPSDQNVISMLYSADKDGNTPLHVAIKKGNFKFAQTLISCATRLTDNDVNVLTICNKEGVSPGDMIGSAENVPREFEQFLWGESKSVKNMLGVRSLTGVPNTMMKDYVSTIGVIAALLATITFTAVFTVPGGLNSATKDKDKFGGTPILLKDAAFHVFMVSDIVAMCLSMMVLFCLLWIMSIGNKRESVVLLDLTIFLLETSFSATLVAFMTGVYVTTIYGEPWLAIFTCALTSFLLLLMRKRFIICLIHRFIDMFVAYQRATSWCRASLSKVPEKIRECNWQQCWNRNYTSWFGDALRAIPKKIMECNWQQCWNRNNTGSRDGNTNI